MVKLKVDGKEIETEEGATILAAPGDVLEGSKIVPVSPATAQP